MHHKMEEFPGWGRSVVHAVVRDVMTPIESVMKNGVRMACADGAERLCFPLLCEYIGDMPEQWLLTCLVQPACTKCLYRGTPDANDPRYQGRNAVNKLNKELANNHPRTDAHALEQRARCNDSVPLRALGYHPQHPFSTNYPFGMGIIDAVGPDLLHQISEVFYGLFDQGMDLEIDENYMERSGVFKNSAKDGVRFSVCTHAWIHWHTAVRTRGPD